MCESLLSKRCTAWLKWHVLQPRTLIGRLLTVLPGSEQWTAVPVGQGDLLQGSSPRPSKTASPDGESEALQEEVYLRLETHSAAEAKVREAPSIIRAPRLMLSSSAGCPPC